MMRRINPKVAAMWTGWIISVLFLYYAAFVVYSAWKGAK